MGVGVVWKLGGDVGGGGRTGEGHERYGRAETQKGFVVFYPRAGAVLSRTMPHVRGGVELPAGAVSL